MIQFLILLTGALAIWLSQDQRPHFAKYACIFGLIGQPFWVYSAYDAKQWGIFALSFFYAYAWGKGFWIYWVKAV